MINYIKLRNNKELWKSAKMISEYCENQGDDCDGCIFLSDDGVCIFLHYNKYGLTIAPEEWEV